LVLRLVTLSVEAFAGLLLQWQPMGYTVTERVVRMFVHLKAIFSPSDEPSTMLGTTSANAATLPPSLVEFQSSAVDAPLSPDTESRAVAILPSTTSDAHTDVLSEPFLQRQESATL
ncbi:hypothetical protein AaE_002959, partial [Aphanomyces astaci]